MSSEADRTSTSSFRSASTSMLAGDEVRRIASEQTEIPAIGPIVKPLVEPHPGGSRRPPKRKIAIGPG